MSVVEALRARVKERIEKEQGVRLSFMPFFVRAACMALKQFPMVNARIDGDHKLIPILSQLVEADGEFYFSTETAQLFKCLGGGDQFEPPPDGRGNP